MPGADAAGPPPVPWQPEILKEFTDELIEAAEEGRMIRFATAAAEAKLPEKLVKEIVSDAHYPPVFKRGLKLSTPRVVAKALNKAGVSAEWADELSFASSLGAIWIQGRKLSAKLDKLIEASKRKAEPEKKP
jgi:hypothetical protein